MKNKAALLALIVASIGVFAAPAPAQLTRLHVGYSAISGDQLPAWAGKETGIFEKNGLDVQVIFFTGGSTAILAPASGHVPIPQVSGPGPLSSPRGGSGSGFI